MLRHVSRGSLVDLSPMSCGAELPSAAPAAEPLPAAAAATSDAATEPDEEYEEY